MFTAGGEMGVADGADHLTRSPDAPQHVFAQALDLVGEAVAIADGARAIVFWSAAASKMFGWSTAEAIGRDVIDVFAAAATNERGSAIFERLQAGERWQGELPVHHRDGSTATALVHLEPIQDEDGAFAGVTGVARDVTAHNRAAHDLHTGAQMFEALLHGAGDLFAVTDPTGVIRSILGPVEPILGVEPAALVGTSLFDLVAPADRDRARSSWARRLTTTEALPTDDYWTTRPDGHWVCLSLLVNNLLDEVDVGGIVVTARDVTERKHVEQARAAVNGASTALVHATTESELFGEICKVVVNDITYHLAWVGLRDPAQPLGVRLVATADHSIAYFEALEHLAGEDLHRGPLITALQSHELYVVQDVAALPDSMPWRRLALDYGYHSMIAIPLPFATGDDGLLAIHSERRHVFSRHAVEVLTELARSLTFGVDALRTRAERSAYRIQLDDSLEAAVRAISAAAELRDPYTAGHQRRVSELAVAIGTELRLDPHLVTGMGVAASIHDVGKLAVPAELLSKPGRLTATEFELIKEHARAGHDVVVGIDFPWPVAEMILQHHERLDGSGYPAGLRGEQLSIGARIIAVADVVEAMQAHRPYRPALGLPAALDAVTKGRGTLFDPAVVDACALQLRGDGFGGSVEVSSK